MFSMLMLTEEHELPCQLPYFPHVRTATKLFKRVANQGIPERDVFFTNKLS